MRSRRLHASLICIAVALTITLFVLISWFKASVVRANRLGLAAMARKYPNFSAEQRIAVLREMQSQLHPAGRDMTLADFLKKLVAWRRFRLGSATCSQFRGQSHVHQFTRC